MAHNDFEQTSVSDSQKRSFFSMFVIMLGFTFFSASMWAGANLGNGLTFKGFIGAVVIGNLILGAYTGLLALIAARTGLSVHLLSRYVFGRYGSYIPSSVLAFTQIGWFGVGVAMFSIPTTSFLMELPSVQNSWFMAGATCNVFGIPYPLPLRLLAILTVLAGVMMSSSAYFGIKALHIISTIAVPAVAVFGCYSAIRALFFDALPPEVVTETVRTGWDLARTHTPPPDAALTMGAAISLAIGSFISGGSCTPDFARFSRTTTIAVTTTVIAFFIGMVAFSQATMAVVLLSAGFIIGYGVSIVYTINQAIVVSRSPAHRYGVTTSTFAAIVDLGSGLGPSVMGLILAFAGYREMYLICAFISLISLVMYWFIHGRRFGNQPGKAITILEE